MSFSAHCDFSISVDGNIVMTNMNGAWNVEGMYKYFHELKSKTQVISTKPWIRVVKLEKFEGGPPELMEILIDIQNWSIENNCIMTFLVGAKQLNEDIIKRNEQTYKNVTLSPTLDLALLEANKLLTNIKS